MKVFQKINETKWQIWTPVILAAIGGLVYFIQSLLFAHTTISNLDEGAYLYKGYLFAEGIYRPFQPYGVLTNKGPLSFLIPGYFQALFGPGLRSGRYLAVIEGFVAVVGVWIVVRRMAGTWLATGAVWVMALSSAVIKVYSVGATQSLIACLLAWMLVFSLGENRPLWQLITSALLASVSILVRQNMVIVLPTLLLYILWQHGFKAGVWSAIFGIGLFLIGHAIYWPEILQMWVGWLPIKPQAWRIYGGPANLGAIWDPSVPFSGKVLAVFEGFRWHFITLSGSLFSLFLLPRIPQWWRSTRVKALFFLGFLFLGLLFLHSYASLDKDYCVFCFAPYLSFFSVVGLVFVALSISAWRTETSLLISSVNVALILIISAGVGFAMFEDTGAWLTSLPFPRMRNGQILPGFNTVGEFLFNKFDLDQGGSRRVAALLSGIFSGMALVMVVALVNYYLKHTYRQPLMLVQIFIIAGLLFSPIMQGSQGAWDCKIDVIQANEENGTYLRSIIPQDSQVYWDGGLSVAPLLYVPQARIYPAQINDGYSFRFGGDSDEFLRKGFWNEELAAKWKQEADIIIVEEWRYEQWQFFLTPNHFAEFPRSPEGTSCLNESRLRIFKRLK